MLDTIFGPLDTLVSGIMVFLHGGLERIGFDPDSGWAWGLAIVGLVIIIRIALIPLFVRQIRATRNMQVLQPRMRELQKKYKNDRQRLTEETMKLYRETGTNPLSSCLPILLQAPFFFALFRVLDGISRGTPRGVLTESHVESAAQAKIFGAHIADKFIGAETVTVQVVTVVMILMMSLSQFITQRQLMVKNLPAEAAKNNPMLQQQKILLYLFPILFAVFGINFPVGVLLYWLVSNFWTMGQQFYVIHFNPNPGSPAHEQLQKRRAARAAKKGQPVDGRPVADAGGTDPGNGEVKPALPRARQQPQRQSRAQRSGKKKKR
jgi:YidC/Oxa1 family membrane protein insertase